MANKTVRNMRPLFILLIYAGTILPAGICMSILEINNQYAGRTIGFIFGTLIGLIEAGISGILGFAASVSMKGSENYSRSIFAYLLPGAVFVALNILTVVMQ